MIEKLGKKKKIIRFVCICIFFGILMAVINTGNILYDFSRLVLIALFLALLTRFIEGRRM